MRFKFNKEAGVAPVIIILIVIAVIGIVVALWFAFMQNMGDKSNEGAEEHQATVIDGTMFEVTTQGSSLECDWKLKYDGPAELTEGKFYTDGANNGRSESSYEYEGQTYETLAIINEDRTYHWSPGRSGNVQGISDERAKYEAREPKYDLLENSINVDFNADYTFTCHPWTVDESVFVAPGDLQFLIL